MCMNFQIHLYMDREEQVHITADEHHSSMMCILVGDIGVYGCFKELREYANIFVYQWGYASRNRQVHTYSNWNTNTQEQGGSHDVYEYGKQVLMKGQKDSHDC